MPLFCVPHVPRVTLHSIGLNCGFQDDCAHPSLWDVSLHDGYRRRGIVGMVQSFSEIRVRYSETDAMGVAHHASYVPWLEQARIELLDHLGLPYRELESAGVSMPVVSLEIQYRAPCRFHDLLRIEVEVTEQPRARMTVHYRILNDGILVATATTVLAFVTPQGRPIRPPQDLTRIFQGA